MLPEGELGFLPDYQGSSESLGSRLIIRGAGSAGERPGSSGRHSQWQAQRLRKLTFPSP